MQLQYAITIFQAYQAQRRYEFFFFFFAFFLSLTITDIWKQPLGAFVKKCILRCVFACVPENTKSRHTDKIRRSLLKICLMRGILTCPGLQSWGQTQNNLAKLGILVEICIFSYDKMVFLCGVYLLLKKMTLFFSIVNKWLYVV